MPIHFNYVVLHKCCWPLDGEEKLGALGEFGEKSSLKL
jgi:hypothetical protein